VISREQVRAVLGDGGVVIGDTGLDLGRIRQVFLDALSYEPAWMTVTSDTWGGAEVVVPLALAWLDEGRISVPYSTAVVRDAPRADTSVGFLGAQHEQDLLRHYGLEGGDAVSAGPVLDGRVDGIRAATPVSGANGHPLPAHRDWRLPRVGTSVHALRGELRPFLNVASLPADELDDLVLATSEAAVNAVEHPQHPVADFFDVRADVDGSHLSITIRDYGLWRDPTPGNGRGRGLLLMSVLSALDITVDPDGTTVTLRNRSPDVVGWTFRRRGRDSRSRIARALMAEARKGGSGDLTRGGAAGAAAPAPTAGARRPPSAARR